MDTKEFLWGYLVELRKEIVERQKIRIQIIYYKFTFISAIGLLIVNSKFPISTESTPSFIEIPKSNLFVIPAIGAIFFDYLLNAYNFTILRIGAYIKYQLEVKLKSMYDIQEIKLWEEFLDNKLLGNPYARIGNSGLTILTMIIAILALIIDFHAIASVVQIPILLFFLFLDIKTFKAPEKRMNRFKESVKKNRLDKTVTTLE